MEDELDEIYDDALLAAKRVYYTPDDDPPVEAVTAFMIAAAIARHTAAVDRQTKAITKLTDATAEAGRRE